MYILAMQKISNCLYLLFCLCPFAYVAGSNWAQTTGRVSQNVAVPSIPKPAHPHWNHRYGMAVVVVDDPENLDDEPRIFLMGGDTYDGDFTGFEKNTREVKWANGYKNDVWRSTGTEWNVDSDVRLKTDFHQKIPRIKSEMRWTQVTAGQIPPMGQTYDYWLRCTPDFKERLEQKGQCNLPENRYQVQWSPRRGHAAVYFKGYIWVLGGRARELSDMPEEDTVGGILSPRVQDIYREQFGVNHDQTFTKQREVSALKSDVWRSPDGETWELVTPGCKAPQSNLVANGNQAENRRGTLANACEDESSPCYSPAESCVARDGHYTCVCDMWSPREQHQVAAYNEYMYVVGGFASRLFSEMSNCGAFACGDVNGGSYRFYMQDVWRSTDGKSWEEVTLGGAFSFPGRGGHQMILLPGDDMTKLMIFGGQTGDPYTNELHYLNDVWWADIDNPAVWYQLTDPEIPWTPRAGHTVTLEPPSAINENRRIIYLVGGVTDDGISGEVWSWWPDLEGDVWRMDYTPQARFRSAQGVNGLYNTSSPSMYYITPDSDLSYMRKFWVPTPSNDEVRDLGARPEIRKYLEPHMLEMLHSVGLHTVRDLATADKYVILKLRGHDFPGVREEDLLDFYDICDYRELALAIVDKCSINYDVEYYDGENKMPWNVNNVFGGDPPVTLPAEWHNRDFLDMHSVTDPVEMVEQWDGCSHLNLETRPNVNGLGKVTQVKSIRKPLLEIQELQCQFNPGPRAYHAALYVEERMYIFGGRKTDHEFYADSWYRDDRMPSVNIKKKPKQNSPNSIFRFAADEAGCYFEYRVWDTLRYKEIRKWSPVVSQTNLEWLDWRKGGPGNGRYALYVRAVDPAGNRDERYERGRNVYAWNYVSPTPWDIIFGCVAAFIFLAFLAYLEYRRRVKKAAMERYAMKRMRRKFKAMQRDLDGRAVDWRTLYQEHKEAKEGEDKDGKKKQKEMKKKREKAKESREKEKAKLAKEKEKIRKKMKDKEKKMIAGSAAGSAPLAIEHVKKTDEKYLSDAKKDKALLKTDTTTTVVEKKHTKRFKDYEIEDVEPGAAAIEGGEKHKKRLKDYEHEGIPENGLTKRSNTKRLKDYEVDEGGKEPKKNV